MNSATPPTPHPIAPALRQSRVQVRLDPDTRRQTQLRELQVAFAQLCNAIAPVVMLRETAKHIIDGGFFVNLSGVVATQPFAGMAAYSASKAAAWAAMTAASRELRRRRIDVIDARPPHTETGLATRPLAGVAPKMPEGLAPDVVATRIVAAVATGERDLPAEAFTS